MRAPTAGNPAITANADRTSDSGCSAAISRPTAPERRSARHTEAGDDPKHTHLVFETDKGARIAFNDARRFGYMDLIPTDRLAEHPYFKGLGPEPLGPDFNAKALKAALANRKQNIKVTLLDQRVVAGLGNI